MRRYFYLLIPLLCSAMSANAQLYRWTDENGKVHYSDKIPTQQRQRGHTTLNKQGVIIDSVAADSTPAQKQHSIQQKKLRALQQEFLQQRHKKDQLLLQQYDSADDLVMTRDGKVVGIERSISAMKKRGRSDEERLAKLQKQIDGIQAAGKPVPVDMIQKLLRMRHSVKESDAEIAREEQKKQLIHERYTRELQRYRHLREPEKYPAPASLEKEPEPLDNVIGCSSRESCKPLWERAVAYVKEHSDTAVVQQTGEIVITEPAAQGQKTRLILSLISEADEGGFSIFMDVQCRASAMGKPCSGPQAKSLLQGFRPGVLKQTAPAP